jgi:hypothetical protein
MDLEAPNSSTLAVTRGSIEEPMRHSLFGALLGASLVIGGLVGRSSSEPAYTPPMELPAHSGGSELFTQVTATDGQPLTVTVVDPRQHVLAVYHVDRSSGEITLKSIRNFTWDLQMIGYNSGKPTPQDIRSGLPH